MLCRSQVVPQPIANSPNPTVRIHIMEEQINQEKTTNGHHCCQKRRSVSPENILRRCVQTFPVLYMTLRIIWVMPVSIEKLKVQSVINTAVIPVTTSFPCEREFQFVVLRVLWSKAFKCTCTNVKMADSSDLGGALSSAKASPLSQ